MDAQMQAAIDKKENEALAFLADMQGTTVENIRGKTRECARKAFFVLLMTRDPQQALKAFGSCVFGLETDTPSPPTPPPGNAALDNAVARC